MSCIGTLEWVIGARTSLVFIGRLRVLPRWTSENRPMLVRCLQGESGSLFPSVDHEYVYRMRDLSRGLSAVRDLDRESGVLLVGMALILLVRDEETDEWYVFANLRDPTSDDTRRILTILSN